MNTNHNLLSTETIGSTHLGDLTLRLAAIGTAHIEEVPAFFDAPAHEEPAGGIDRRSAVRAGFRVLPDISRSLGLGKVIRDEWTRTHPEINVTI
jgi:hypothetical protein